ncbi:hypothetical protein DPMN_161019 [Dreissena polymorpha]|uniref:Uncharacterized protein n=1 Tax=Dreissena polymorpha TaxID=45954 RepID=A0A9D4ENW4_DREPO|nr:hypothetical protein DPMN_161019 [Dreissena polymorpha]
MTSSRDAITAGQQRKMEVSLRHNLAATPPRNALMVTSLTVALNSARKLTARLLS